MKNHPFQPLFGMKGVKGNSDTNTSPPPPPPQKLTTKIGTTKQVVPTVDENTMPPQPQYSNYVSHPQMAGYINNASFAKRTLGQLGVLDTNKKTLILIIIIILVLLIIGCFAYKQQQQEKQLQRLRKRVRRLM